MPGTRRVSPIDSGEVNTVANAAYDDKCRIIDSIYGLSYKPKRTWKTVLHANELGWGECGEFRRTCLAVRQGDGAQAARAGRKKTWHDGPIVRGRVWYGVSKHWGTPVASPTYEVFALRPEAMSTQLRGASLLGLRCALRKPVCMPKMWGDNERSELH
jgi:hypothetical protein